MKFEVRAIDEIGRTEVLSLERWFLQDADVAGKCEIRRSYPANAGEMTAVFDAVIAITSQAMTLGNLLIAYATWRGTRHHPSKALKVTVELNGSTIEVSGMSNQEIRELATSITSRTGPE